MDRPDPRNNRGDDREENFDDSFLDVDNTDYADDQDDQDVDDIPSDDEDSIDDADGDDPNTIAELTALVNKLEATVEDLTAASHGVGDEPGADYEDMNFFENDDEFRDADASTINEKLNAGFRKYNEFMLKSIPKMAQKVAQQQVAMMRMADKFYGENPDLNKHRDFVGRLFAKELEKNPSLSWEQAMDNVAKGARNRLGLKAVAKKKGGRKSSDLPKKRGSAPPKRAESKLSRQEGQIDEMIKHLGT